MADLEFDPYEGAYPATHQRFGRALNIGGAVCSVALVLGLGIWGYRLAVRDVSGVPVFRAIEGPLRTAPADPGGQQASYQGLSVNAVAAAGVARPVPESLRLAPQEVDLTDEDVAGLADLPLSAVSAEAGAQDMAPTPVLADDGQAGVSAALAEAMGDEGGVATPAPVVTDAALDVATDAITASEAVLPMEEAEAEPSVRPRARPATLQQAAAKVTETVEPPVAAPVDVASLTAGAQLVQLGAFDTENQAQQEWSRLEGQFATLLSGKAMVVQAAQSGGRTFYRLRAAGFGGAEDARAFCNTLLTGNSTCIPVTQR